MRTVLKNIAFVIVAKIYTLFFPGRIFGNSFIIRCPSLIKVEKTGKIILGKGVHIEPGARIVVKSVLTIKDNVYIGKNVTIVAFEPLEIGAGTLIAENVSIHTEDHGPAGQRDAFATAPVLIHDDVWICAGVVVTKGTEIGAGSTVAANAVVTRNVPAASLARGIPAVSSPLSPSDISSTSQSK